LADALLEKTTLRRPTAYRIMKDAWGADEIPARRCRRWRRRFVCHGPLLAK